MSWYAAIPAIASLAGSFMQSEGQKDANETNLQIQQNNSAFNAEQAAMNRDWSAEEALKNRSFQHDEAQTQMEYQERMAGTAWQRGIADLKKANMNPMLAYSQGGAQSGAGAAGHGSMATSSAASAGAPGNMQNRFAAAGATAGQWAQIENIMADTDKKRAEEELVRDQAATEKGRPANLAADTDRIRKLAELLRRQHGLTDAQTDKVAAEIQTELRKPENVDASTGNLKADTALKNINTILQKHDIPRMSAESDYFKTLIGKESPHNKYGPQTPFRLFEGLGERIINRNAARLYPQEGGERKPW